MQENRSMLMSAAMSYGLIMGCFWVFKYLFFMFSQQHPSLMGFYWGLTIMVPYMAYKQINRYRQQLGGRIGFFHAWQLGVLIYFFAGVMVSLAHYVFYRYMVPSDFLSNSISEAVRLMQNQQVDDTVIQAVQEIRFTPIQMALQGILNNTFYGLIFSVPIAALACRKNDRS